MRTPRPNPPNRNLAWAAILGSAVLVMALILVPILDTAPGPAGHRPAATTAHAQDAARTGGGGSIRVAGESRRIDTAFYTLRLTKYALDEPAGPLDPAERPLHFGVLGDGGLLLATRLGNLYHLTLEAGGGSGGGEDLAARKLAATFPINLEEFESFAKNRKLDKYVKKQWFRINDLHIDVEDGERVLYVSHQFFDAEGECFTSRISKLDGSVSDLLAGEPPAPARWRTLYETAPCLPLKETGNHRFEGHQAGGRIAGLDRKSLLFTVGDHGFDGKQGEHNYPQATGASYGKILEIDRETGRSGLYSLGHRNPQGLYRDPGGAVYATEHGPRGGDELNRIEEGKNYGWPHAIYGTAYDAKVWPLAGAGDGDGAGQNSHRGYERPVFAWIPSIGISNLAGVERGLFPVWRGNLLVASLRGKSVYRMQMHERRVVYVERIELGEGKIRDIAEAPNGEIWLATDTLRMLRLRPRQATAAPAAVAAGKKLFASCAECHTAEENGAHGLGPNLHGVFGKRIAGSEGYDYSPALRARSPRRWTRENILAFLEDPQAFAPGTKKQFQVPDPRQRRELLRYLQSLAEH